MPSEYFVVSNFLRGEASMVRTPSTMLPLGTSAPDFHLPNIDGRGLGFQDVAGSRGTVVMFICIGSAYVSDTSVGSEPSSV